MTLATQAHVHAAIDGMRDDERAQLWAGFRWTPAEAVWRCVEESAQTWAAIVDGEVMAVFGVVPHSTLLRIGIPWLATTAAVERHPKTFYRLCRAILPGFREKWPTLIGAISQRHERSLAWARHLGFDIGEPIPTGPDGAPFHRVELRS